MPVIARGIFRDNDSEGYYFSGKKIVDKCIEYGLPQESAMILIGELIAEAITADTDHRTVTVRGEGK